ncbi:MAG: helix-turn-helix domain-containing protein [Thermofilaceae archaeon]
MGLEEKLKASGFEVVGEEGSTYSFDMIAVKGENAFAIKVLERPGIEEIKKYVTDLKRISIPLDLTPLFVCEEGAPDDVLVTFEGVPSITAPTLLKLTSDAKPPFVYISRGGVYVKVRGEYIRKRRLEQGMSLGDLSLLLGVTRRMVYEYETGRSDVTVEVAKKMLRVFGEEAFEQLSLNGIREHFKKSRVSEQTPTGRIRDPTLRRIHGKLLSAGFVGLAIERAPFQLAAKREKGIASTKLVIRKSYEEEEFEEQFTLEVAKLCKSYALFVTGDKVRVVGRQVVEARAEELEECLREPFSL